MLTPVNIALWMMRLIGGFIATRIIIQKDKLSRIAGILYYVSVGMWVLSAIWQYTR